MIEDNYITKEIVEPKKVKEVTRAYGPTGNEYGVKDFEDFLYQFGFGSRAHAEKAGWKFE